MLESNAEEQLRCAGKGREQPKAKDQSIKNKCVGVPWWHSRLRIWHCHCCGSGSIFGLGTSTGKDRKKKKKDKCVNGKVNKVWPGALALKQLWAQRGWGTVRTQPDITPSPAPSHQGHTLPEPLWSWLESCLPSQIPRAHCPAPVGQAHGTWKMHILRKR